MEISTEKTLNSIDIVAKEAPKTATFADQIIAIANQVHKEVSSDEFEQVFAAIIQVTYLR